MKNTPANATQQRQQLTDIESLSNQALAQAREGSWETFAETFNARNLQIQQLFASDLAEENLEAAHVLIAQLQQQDEIMMTLAQQNRDQTAKEWKQQQRAANSIGAYQQNDYRR